MIKGKASFPFETIALAVAFSPRLESLIAETRRLTEIHQARAVFIHAGKKTSEKQRMLSVLLLNYGFNDTNSVILWEQGNPVEAILSACKLQVVDLLILGALEKENVVKYYMGSVAREIGRKAKCSVLLLTNPRIQPVAFSNIVVNGHDHPKTESTVRTAVYLAEKEGVEEITVVDEVELPALSMSMANDNPEADSNEIHVGFINDENIRLSNLVESIQSSSVRLHTRTVSGRSGHTISRFAQQAGADLLIVNSPDHLLSIFDRIFTHDLEYMLTDIPCNMLIVHTRMPEQAG